MSSLAEIQEAIISLGEEEKEALLTWLASQDFPRLRPDDEKHLMESLDRAARNLDGGKGTSVSEARKLVRAWAGR